VSVEGCKGPQREPISKLTQHRRSDFHFLFIDRLLMPAEQSDEATLASRLPGSPRLLCNQEISIAAVLLSSSPWEQQLGTLQTTGVQ
jgi:hypothetical protein